MSKLIEGLNTLNVKWPGLFDFLAVAYGYKSQDDLDFKSLEALNTRVLCDEEGLTIFMNLIAQTMAEGLSFEEVEFLKENGLVDKKDIEMRDRILELGEKLKEDPTDDERDAIMREIEELGATADRKQQAGMLLTAKGAEALKILA
jgi:hypothetical protein